LSATYHDILKDRLYTLGANHPLRRSSQTALHHIFGSLARLLAPVITFTADEAWTFGTAGREYADDSVHLQDWPVIPAAWRCADLAAEIGLVIFARSGLQAKMEALRKDGGKTIDLAVTVTASGQAHRILARHLERIPELFVVSTVNLQPIAPASAIAQPDVTFGSPEQPDAVSFVVQRDPQPQCPRCWRHVPALNPTAHGEVCPRCAQALNS